MTEAIPATLEAAVDTIIASLDEESRTYILDPKNSAAGAHFGGGMAMRNQWGLWHDSVLAKHFKTRFGLGHADDMSGIILDSVYAKVRGEPYDIDARVAHYKAHWRKAGIDPLTQQKFGESDAEINEGKNAGGIDWKVLDIPGATIRHQPQPRRTFWQKVGDAIYGQR